jgi:hypothetical protein
MAPDLDTPFQTKILVFYTSVTANRRQVEFKMPEAREPAECRAAPLFVKAR